MANPFAFIKECFAAILQWLKSQPQQPSIWDAPDEDKLKPPFIHVVECPTCRCGAVMTRLMTLAGTWGDPDVDVFTCNRCGQWLTHDKRQGTWHWEA